MRKGILGLIMGMSFVYGATVLAVETTSAAKKAPAGEKKMEVEKEAEHTEMKKSVEPRHPKHKHPKKHHAKHPHKHHHHHGIHAKDAKEMKHKPAVKTGMNQTTQMNQNIKTSQDQSTKPAMYKALARDQ